MSYKAVVFDLDGTLIDSLKTLQYHTNTTLTDIGLNPFPLERFRYFVGDGPLVLMQRALQANEKEFDNTTNLSLEEVFERYMEHYQGAPGIYDRVYDGVREMLLAFRQAGWRVGVFTNKPKESALRVLAYHFPDFTFDGVEGFVPGMPRKPDPTLGCRMVASWGMTPSEVLYVGDTDVDMITAKRAGFTGIGVLWGFRGRAELEEHGARAVVEHPQELLEWLNR